MKCAMCGNEIQKEGIMVQGNIMTYPDKGGLIGSLDYLPLKVEECPEQIFCLSCFHDATIGNIRRHQQDAKTIDIGKEFSNCLVDRVQAATFVDKYLKELMIQDAWTEDGPFIIFDFVNVRKISPSFANEAFANFLNIGATSEKILKKILFKNISNVQMEVINIELSGIPELGDEFFENAKVYKKGEIFKKLKRSE